MIIQFHCTNNRFDQSVNADYNLTSSGNFLTSVFFGENDMTVHHLTALLFIVIVLATGLVDAWASITGRPTVSSVIRQWCIAYPPLPFVAGFVSYHLFGMPFTWSKN